MAMDMTTGDIRPLDTDEKQEAFADLVEKLQSNEVALAGNQAHIDRLQKLVREKPAQPFAPKPEPDDAA